MEHFQITQKLHTDILEEKYGEIRAVVHIHDNTHRVVDLCDIHNISRTRAITIFLKDSWNEDIYEIDKIIQSGGAIGKTFREHGYEVRKNVISVYVIQLSSELQKAFSTLEKTAKIRLSEFYAKSLDSSPIIYGIVAEIYSPDFRSGAVNNIDFSQINPLTEVCEQQGATKNDLREILGKENDRSQQKLSRESLKDQSQYKIITYQNSIATYL